MKIEKENISIIMTTVDHNNENQDQINSMITNNYV